MKATIHAKHGRNNYLTFARTNKYKVGLNLMSNQLRLLSNCITKNIMKKSKDTFKTYYRKSQIIHTKWPFSLNVIITIHSQLSNSDDLF